jgi:hypothetical protein
MILLPMKHDRTAFSRCGALSLQAGSCAASAENDSSITGSAPGGAMARAAKAEEAEGDRRPARPAADPAHHQRRLDASGILEEMAISPRMLAVLQKVDAAREEFLAGLRESAKREAKAKARAKTLAKTRRRKPAVKDPE